MERLYVDRTSGSLRRSDLYLVTLITADGTVYKNLEPKRLFPVTRPDSYITLLDEKEKEVALIRNMQELDEQSREALTDCFREYYMIPKITKVLACDDKFGIVHWTVETDRGQVHFRIRNRNSDIKHLWGSNRILVRDSDDNRYEIEDYTTLDTHSRYLLFSYL